MRAVPQRNFNSQRGVKRPSWVGCRRLQRRGNDYSGSGRDCWRAATARAREATLTCHIDFIVELTGVVAQDDTFIEYTGTMGGEAGRVVLNPDGSGFALIGDAFSQIRARLTYPSTVHIESVNLPPGPVHDPPGFFEEIVDFTGTFGPGDLISGDWLRAPFFTDLGGFADETLFADGTWFTQTIDQ